MEPSNNKITQRHLAKTAYLYIRQSTLRQVQENTESTLRQYALKDRLVSMGWARTDIVVIDRDLGRSGKDGEHREGFKKLVADVANGQAGAVACIEASRLSRSSSDWGRLVEYCAMTNTLLLDADGVYDPNDFNDRLLLGLKGTMSEAELHFLKERMRGGLLNKARRGELKKPLPIGYIYDSCDRIIKDTDQQVREALELFFHTFRQIGSAHGMVVHYQKKGYRIPHRVHSGTHKGEVQWVALGSGRAQDILHNPMYAGVYHYGEKQQVWTKEGLKLRSTPRDEWYAFIKDHHEGYISYEDFELNEDILRKNAHPRAGTDQKTPPREGPALLQGIALCGRCGKHMSIRYTTNKAGFRIPHYMCQREALEYGGKACQNIHGSGVDQVISRIVKEHFTPESIRLATDVQKEAERRKTEHLHYYQLQVEKARYEAELARRRYMSVDPENRLVSLSLESDWNIRLKQLEEAEHTYAQECRKDEIDTSNDSAPFCPEALVRQFNEIWDHPEVSAADKKRILRQLIEDVTLTDESKGVHIQICFKGGTTQELYVDHPQGSYIQWVTPEDVVAFLRKEGGEDTSEHLAERLNASGMRSGKSVKFTARQVSYIMKAYGITNIYETYVKRGYVGTKVKAEQLGISISTLQRRVSSGKFKGEVIHVTGNDLLFKL